MTPHLLNLENPPGNAYDPCTPGALPLDQVSLAETVHRKFLHTWALSVSDYLQTQVMAAFGASSFTFLSEFLSDPEMAGCILKFELTPGPASMYVALGPGLLSRVLGFLLGGPAAPAVQSCATEIEMHILRDFFDRLILDLHAAWSPRGIEFHLQGIQSAAELEVPAEESLMVVLRSTLQFEDQEVPFGVAFPPIMVRLATAESGDGAHRGQPAAREDLRTALGRARMDVEAVLVGSSLRMRDLLAMEPGHVVALSQPAHSPIDCRINGVSKFQAELIQSRERAAILIKRLANSPE